MSCSITSFRLVLAQSRPLFEAPMRNRRRDLSKKDLSYRTMSTTRIIRTPHFCSGLPSRRSYHGLNVHKLEYSRLRENRSMTRLATMRMSFSARSYPARSYFKAIENDSFRSNTFLNHTTSRQKSDIVVVETIDNISTSQIMFQSLEREVDPERHRVVKKTSAYVREEFWEGKTSLIVLAGGQSSRYESDLGKKGAEKISRFVRSYGKSFFGTCAGAYFGAKEVHFVDDRKIVMAQKPLQFFPGKAVGPVNFNDFGYVHNSERGAHAILVSPTNGMVPYAAYYNGGCYFESPEQHPDVKVLGNFTILSNVLAMMIECRFEENEEGKIGKAVLSGTHIEVNASDLTLQILDHKRIYFPLIKDEIHRREHFRDILRILGIHLNFFQK